MWCCKCGAHPSPLGSTVAKSAPRKKLCLSGHVREHNPQATTSAERGNGGKGAKAGEVSTSLADVVGSMKTSDMVTMTSAWYVARPNGPKCERCGGVQPFPPIKTLLSFNSWRVRFQAEGLQTLTLTQRPSSLATQSLTCPSLLP
jgi:hypothetical protein